MPKFYQNQNILHPVYSRQSFAGLTTQAAEHERRYPQISAQNIADQPLSTIKVVYDDLCGRSLAPVLALRGDGRIIGSNGTFKFQAFRYGRSPGEAGVDWSIRWKMWQWERDNIASRRPSGTSRRDRNSSGGAGQAMWRVFHFCRQDEKNTCR